MLLSYLSICDELCPISLPSERPGGAPMLPSLARLAVLQLLLLTSFPPLLLSLGGSFLSLRVVCHPTLGVPRRENVLLLVSPFVPSTSRGVPFLPRFVSALRVSESAPPQLPFFRARLALRRRVALDVDAMCPASAYIWTTNLAHQSIFCRSWHASPSRIDTPTLLEPIIIEPSLSSFLLDSIPSEA